MRERHVQNDGQGCSFYTQQWHAMMQVCILVFSSVFFYGNLRKQILSRMNERRRIYLVTPKGPKELVCISNEFNIQAPEWKLQTTYSRGCSPSDQPNHLFLTAYSRDVNTYQDVPNTERLGGNCYRTPWHFQTVLPVRLIEEATQSAELIAYRRTSCLWLQSIYCVKRHGGSCGRTLTRDETKLWV